MTNYIVGYKALDSELKTFNEMQYRVGEHFHISGEIKAGPCGGHGLHLCKNFEDTFRFGPKKNPVLCEVIGYGEIREYNDEYNGYYDIYACSSLYVKRIISREEIIEMAKELSSPRLQRLIWTYKMTDEEIDEIKRPSDIKVMQFIDYHHNGNKEAFRK